MVFELNRKNCIRKKPHFDHVFQYRTYIESNIIRLYYAPKLNVNGSVGFIASKKCGGAVQRNACKRRLKEFYRNHPSIFNQNLDYIFIAKSQLMKDNTININTQLSDLIKKTT